jgi:hypothetical protein
MVASMIAPPNADAASRSIGGSTAGLAEGASVTLRLNGGQDLVVAGNRSFSFPAGLADGATYHVSVARPPQYRTCIVSGGAGTVSGANVTSVRVNCSSLAVPTADGDVVASVLSEDGQTLFIGGRFKSLGQPLGGFARLDPSTGSPAPPWSNLVGVVSVVVSDGASGWYVGGSISQIEGLPRTGVVHVRANGSLDTAFNAPANGAVQALLLHGGRLYVGGSFSQIGGQARSGLAVLDPVSGLVVTGWAPQPDGAVRSLATDGNVIYAAGSFGRIGGQARSRLAALDPATGNASSWNPAPVSAGGVDVRSVAVVAGTVFVGGRFEQIGARVRQNVAALSPATAAALEWNPGCSAPVDQVLAGGTRLYLRSIEAGTSFSCGGGAPAALVVLSAGGNSALPFQAAPNGLVRSLALDGNTLYLAGDFSVAGGASRSGLAALQADTGLATPLNTAYGPSVQVVAATAGRLAIGGTNLVGRRSLRNGLAALSMANGAVKSWNPAPAFDPGLADSHAVWVSSLLRVGSTLYVGGNFNRIGPQVRDGIAAVDASSGALLAFVAELAFADVLAMSINGNRLFVGSPSNLHALDPTSGTLQWTAGSNGAVRALRSVNGRLYVGGDFKHIGGQSRSGAAAYELTSLALSDWDPELSRLGGAPVTVRSLVPVADRVYLGGMFDAAGDQIRANLAAVDVGTGLVQPWNPGVTGSGRTVHALRPSGSLLYVGGSFGQVAGTTRVHLAAIDTTTGAVSPWAPRPDNKVLNLLVIGDAVVAGGSFSAIDGRPVRGLAWLPR